MILTLTEMFVMDGGKYSILGYNNERLWVMERAWKFNERNVSCVPRDEYRLEKHNTEKYPNTYALIGTGVSHGKEKDVPRFACVIHSAVYPMDLQGCLAPCESVNHHGMTVGSREATVKLLAELNKGDHHTLMIQ